MTELLYLAGKTGSKTAGTRLSPPLPRPHPPEEGAFVSLHLRRSRFSVPPFGFLMTIVCVSSVTVPRSHRLLPSYCTINDANDGCGRGQGPGRGCGVCCGVGGGRSLLVGSAPFRLLPRYMCAKAIKMLLK